MRGAPVFQVIEALQGVDRVIGQLMNGLKQIGLHRCLNIVIVADHGTLDPLTETNHHNVRDQCSIQCVSYILVPPIPRLKLHTFGIRLQKTL